jgi:hypothetical protein
LQAFAKARLNFLAALASGLLCSEAPCVWYRGLRCVDLPPAALVFRLRLRLFGSRFVCACLLFVRLRRSYFQCSNDARFTSFGTRVHRRRQNPSNTQLFISIDLLQRHRLQGSAAVGK